MKTKLIKYETFCPLFPGFYGTHFDYDGENEDMNSYNEEHETDYTYEDFTFNYADYRKRVGVAFVNRLESELKPYLDIRLHFEDLYSPREYNFENDSINVSVHLNLKELIKLIKDRSEDAAKYFKEKYTSYDGFYSSHSHELEDWINPKYILENTKHRIGALLDCLCSIEIEGEDIVYWTDSENWIDFEVKQLANS